MRESLVSLKREESGLQKQYLQSPTPPPTPHVLVSKNTFTDVIDNTCDMHQRLQSAHFLPSDDSRTTKEAQ